ncbi:g11798 [Coccomyxa elongata]
MRSLLLLLLVAAAGSCHAGFISILSQGLPQGGTLYILGGQQTDSQPRTSGMFSRIQLTPMNVQFQGDSAAQAFSSVFTDRRSSLFDSAISSWMDQQLAALDSLQSMDDTAPSMKMPCPRARAAAAAATASQANLPDVLAYMASSRFGPAMLSSIAQQSVTESDGEADDYGYYDSDSEDVDGADLADEMAGFDAAGMGEYTPQVVTSGYASEQPVFQEESMEGFATDGRGFYSSMLAEEDDEVQDFPASLAPGQVISEDDGPSWFFVLDDGTINWGFILFLLLGAAVLGLWFHICRSAARLFRVHRAQRAEAAQFLSSAQAPLLSEWRAAIAPLAPEKPVAQAAAPEIFSAVEVASVQAPRGTFFAPKGNEYVTIAYVPLEGEQ